MKIEKSWEPIAKSVLLYIYKRYIQFIYVIRHQSCMHAINSLVCECHARDLIFTTTHGCARRTPCIVCDELHP